MSPKTIGIVGFDGVTASHLTGPADAFAVAALDDGFGGRIPCYKVWTVGLTAASFTADSGTVFYPQKTLADAPVLDTIIVPGGSGARAGTDLLAEWILSRTYETPRIASICNGVYALAATGLLSGREVTTHWRCARDLARRHPGLRIDHRRSLVKDGPFYTSAGLTAGIELAFALIEEDYGHHVALAAAQELMISLPNQNTEKELPKPSAFDSQPIDRFAELVAWIVRHLHEDLSVHTLARRACMSPSHFNRAFKSVFGSTPADFVENLRLNEARRRLSVPKRTLDTIAVSVGFSDREAFQRAFERRFGTKARSCLEKADPATAMPPFNGKVSSRALTRERLVEAAR